MDKLDILSEVFSTLKLSSHLSFAAELRGDFAVEIPEGQRRIRFHLARQGRCWVAVSGADPVELTDGDLAIVPNGATQVVASDLRVAAVPLPALVASGALADGVLTFGGLAKLAGMSRARFAERFTALVGVPPIGYLTAWRLMKARALLADTGLDMAEIAECCGYASVPSFSRRFKQAFDVGSGAYRRSRAC